jgi:hypothetical protein
MASKTDGKLAPSLMEAVRDAVATQFRTLYDSVLSDVSGAATAVSDRVTAITDITTSQCMKDTSDSTDGVTIPKTHLALLDALAKKHPRSFDELIAAAEAHLVAAPLDRRGVVERAFVSLEKPVDG